MDSPPAEMAGLPSRFPPIVSRFCVAPHYLTPAVRRYEPLGRASPVTLECSTWPDQSDWQNLRIFFLLFLIWRRDQVPIRAAREEPQPCISNCCPASRAPHTRRKGEIQPFCNDTATTILVRAQIHRPSRLQPAWLFGLGRIAGGQAAALRFQNSRLYPSPTIHSELTREIHPHSQPVVCSRPPSADSVAQAAGNSRRMAP